jgi:hypothetical protein
MPQLMMSEPVRAGVILLLQRLMQEVAKADSKVAKEVSHDEDNA